MFVDTHTHIEKDFFEDVDKVIKDAFNNNVKIIILNGHCEASFKEVINIAKKHNNVYVALGYHPSDIDIFNDYDLSILEKFLTNEKVVALGEIGLDYYYDKSNIEKQKDLFIKQITLAEKYNLPIIIHSRDAYNDTLNILKNNKKKTTKGVLHCYSYSYDKTANFIELGMFFGIGGVITFKNAKKLQEVVLKVPLEYILLETDAPFLAPTPLRGQINESKNIPIIALKIAKIKNISIDEVAKITTNNATGLFDIKY